MDGISIEIDFRPDRDDLVSRLGMERDSEEAHDFLALLDKVAPLTRPKGFVGNARIDEIVDDETVVIGGVVFVSRLLVANLRDVDRVWPYLATCGRELYEFAKSIPDPFERFWLDEIMQQALSEARTALDKLFEEKLYAGKSASMSPGSLPEWPLEEQRPLFRLLDGAADKCGVELNDSLLMLPHKSVSGFRFPNKHGYVNCRLCPRERCPNRRAAFDREFAIMIR